MIGKPKLFDVELYLDLVEGMIMSDEIERAFLMLDNMPAYYRDHVPERAKEIRQSLHRQLWTPVQYVGIYDGFTVDMESTLRDFPNRGKLLCDIILQFNAKGAKPHVIELAPGPERYVEKCLRSLGADFIYDAMGLDERTSMHPIKRPFIFIAFEIIEHLANEFEIYQNYLKIGHECDLVMLSTPLYSYNGGFPDWRLRDLGHLRAYTPAEFKNKAQEMFKDREWECFVDDTIILIGRKHYAIS